MKNGTHRTALFLCLVMLLLLVLRMAPAVNVGGHELEQVDCLADIVRKPDPVLPPVVLPKAAAKAKTVQRDTCPRGMVCIEDYAPDSAPRGMQPFYAALAGRSALGRPVRIAYFGDSYIEGDILTADLRAYLQRQFGGCGVGFVDIASPFTKLRASVAHSASGWTDHSVLEKSGCDRSQLGISQRYAVPADGATVSYRGVKSYARLDTFDVATLYLSSSAPLSVTVTANDAGGGAHVTRGDGRVETVAERQRMGRVRFRLDGVQHAVCYGVALEGENGVTLDNFSLRGSSGIPLASVPASHLAQLNALRPYDLIVLQFGLNVASKKQLKYDAYVSQMKRVVAHLKRAFPEAGILIVSVGDREDRVDGELRTMPGVKALVRYQQALAAEEGIAFWNLYEAMGGEGAVRRMALSSPPEAAKDYTHINRRGGKRIAGILYKVLLHGYKQYQKNQGNEESK